jgi:hypothetical protein
MLPYWKRAFEPVWLASPYMLLGAVLIGFWYGVLWGIVSFFVYVVAVWVAAYLMLKLDI